MEDLKILNITQEDAEVLVGETLLADMLHCMGDFNANAKINLDDTRPIFFLTSSLRNL